MTVEEFWFTYNGSAKEYLERQATKKAADSTSFLHMMEVRFFFFFFHINRC